MERHGLRLPSTTFAAITTGRLSPMAFLVGVSTRGIDTPTRRVQRLSAAVPCAGRSELAALNRGRAALPPQGGGKRDSLFAHTGAP